MEIKRKEFDNLIDSLNKFEIEYLEKEYLKSGGTGGFKDLHIWLYNRWCSNEI